MSDMNEFITKLIGNDVDCTLALPDPSLLQYYHDLENRTIWIDEEIDGMTLDVVSKIIRWNQEDKDKPVEARKPIRILFNSPGGSLDVEETLVSIIKLSKTPVYGIALGMVASAASLIYLSCAKRFALRNAYFIFHRGSCQNIGGNFNEIQAAMDDYKVQIAKLERFYIENTGYTEEEIKKNIVTDWYIRGNELIEKGVVHEWIDSIDIFL